jgi:hypothetical protein
MDGEISDAWIRGPQTTKALSEAVHYFLRGVHNYFYPESRVLH